MSKKWEEWKAKEVKLEYIHIKKNHFVTLCGSTTLRVFLLYRIYCLKINAAVFSELLYYRDKASFVKVVDTHSKSSGVKIMRHFQ